MKLFFLISGLFFFTVTQNIFAKEEYMVAPTRMELDLSKPRASFYMLTNTGNEKIRITASPIYIGLQKFEELSLLKNRSSKEDISKYIKLSPKTISLNPGEKRNIRILVKPTQKLSPGEYRAHVLFKTIPIKKQKKKKKQKNKFETNIDFKIQTASVIYGYVGNPKPKIKYSCYYKHKKPHIKVLNTGNARFDGEINLYSANKKELINNTSLFLLRETKTDKKIDTKVIKWRNYFIEFKTIKDSDVILSGICKFK